MRKFDMGKIYRVCSVIAFCAFCALMTNCTLFGTGNFLYTFGVSVIGITVVAMGLFSVPVLLVDFQRIIKNVTLWVLIAFAAWNGVALVVGLRNGNEIAAIMADVNGVMYYVLFPVILGVLNSRKRVHALMKCMMAASFVQSFLACLLLWSYVSDLELFTKLLTYCNYGYFINFTNISATIPRILFVSAPFQLCGCAFSLYFIVREKKVAVQYVLPLAMGLFTILLTYTRALYVGAFVTAMLLVVLYLIYERKPVQQKKFWLGVCASVLIFAVLVCGFSLNAKTNYFAYGLNRVFSGLIVETPEQTEPTTDSNEETAPAPATEPDATTAPATEPDATTAPATEPDATTAPATEPDATTAPATEPDATTAPATEPDATTAPVTEPDPTVAPDEPEMRPEDYMPGIDGSYTEDTYINATVQSDLFREEMKNALLDMIRQSPITGHGLGAVLPGGRANAEYSFLDLGAKKGVVGLVLYLIPVLLMAFSVVKDIITRRKLLLSGVWLSVLLGFFAFSVFQPYLNNAPCMLMHCCALCVRYAEEKELAEENGTDTFQKNN